MNQIKILIQKHKDDLAQLEREYLTKREKMVFLIQALETALTENPSKRRGRRPNNGHSVAELAQQILTKWNGKGLTVPMLLLELKSLGYKSEAEDKANTVNSLLHREKDRFVRRDDKWFLTTDIPAFRHTDTKDESVETGTFPAILMSILADGRDWDEGALAQKAQELGWNFQGKNPKSSVHGGLLNAAKRGLVQTRNKRWFKVKPAPLGSENPDPSLN